MRNHNNTSSQNLITLRRLSIFLAFLGILVASYLTYLHVTDTGALLCAEGGGCDTVRDSRYSEVAGIPVALVGLAGYLLIVGGLLLEEFSPDLSQYTLYAVFGFSLFGVLYSIYLTYLEIYIIVAICPYCVISAILIVGIFALTLYRILQLTNETE